MLLLLTNISIKLVWTLALNEIILTINYDTQQRNNNRLHTNQSILKQYYNNNSVIGYYNPYTLSPLYKLKLNTKLFMITMYIIFVSIILMEELRRDCYCAADVNYIRENCDIMYEYNIIRRYILSITVVGIKNARLKS